jgi:hypothetical protein
MEALVITRSNLLLGADSVETIFHFHTFSTAVTQVLRERDHLEDPGVDGRIILKWTCERLDGGAWTGSIWLRIGTGGELS